MAPPVAATLARAFNRYFQGDVEAVGYVAAPQIERLVRDIVLAVNEALERFEQVDALKAFAVNPVKYLVVPRFLGMVIGQILVVLSRPGSLGPIERYISRSMRRIRASIKAIASSSFSLIGWLSVPRSTSTS